MMADDSLSGSASRCHGAFAPVSEMDIAPFRHDNNNTSTFTAPGLPGRADTFHSLV